MEKLLEEAIEGFGQIAMHEAGALDNHVLALQERWRLARRARGVGELLRDQFDLLPATGNRVRADHRTRVRLWNELARKLATSR